MKLRRMRVGEFGQPFDGCHGFDGATRPRAGSTESVISKVLMASGVAFPRMAIYDFGKTDSTDWTDSTEKHEEVDAILPRLYGQRDDTAVPVLVSEAKDRFLPRRLNCHRPKAIPRRFAPQDDARGYAPQHNERGPDDARTDAPPDGGA